MTTLTISTKLEIKDKTEKSSILFPSTSLIWVLSRPWSLSRLRAHDCTDRWRQLGTRLTFPAAPSTACAVWFARVWTESPVFPKDDGAALWPPGPWENSPKPLGFPSGSDGKESSWNAGDLGSIPGLGRTPGGGHSNPPQYSCLEDPRGQRSLAGYSPWGWKESDVTEWSSTAHARAPSSSLLPESATSQAPLQGWWPRLGVVWRGGPDFQGEVVVRHKPLHICSGTFHSNKQLMKPVFLRISLP